MSGIEFYLGKKFKIFEDFNNWPKFPSDVISNIMFWEDAAAVFIKIRSSCIKHSVGIKFLTNFHQNQWNFRPGQIKEPFQFLIRMKLKWSIEMCGAQSTDFDCSVCLEAGAQIQSNLANCKQSGLLGLLTESFTRCPTLGWSSNKFLWNLICTKVQKVVIIAEKFSTCRQKHMFNRGLGETLHNNICMHSTNACAFPLIKKCSI